MPTIRWVLRTDLPRLAQLDAASFDRPWSAERLQEVLRRRHCIGRVIEHGGEALGYLIYSLYPRRVVILRVAVDPQARRQGLGRRLLSDLLARREVPRRSGLEIRVQESWLAAQLLLRACGVPCVDVLPRGPEGEPDYLFRLGPA